MATPINPNNIGVTANTTPGAFNSAGQSVSSLESAMLANPQRFDPTPYNITGTLNFGSTDGTYQNAYNNVLSINSQNYSNVLKGFQGLSASVLGNIKGISDSARQDVTDQYARAGGQALTSLTSRGLGNTTVRDSVTRGLGYDQAKAYTDVSNKFAGTYAGFQSNLGQAQLGFMERVSAPYPNAQNYVNPYAGQQPSRGGGLQPGGGGGGAYMGGGVSGGWLPQTPSGNYGGGAYSYVPPAHGQAQDIDFTSPAEQDAWDAWENGEDLYSPPANAEQDAWNSWENGEDLYEPAYPQSYGGEYVYPAETSYGDYQPSNSSESLAWDAWYNE